MGQFYQLLRDYNIKNYIDAKVPEWSLIYTEEEAPIYYKVLEQELKELDKDSFIVEVGSGVGDIIAMLRSLGFSNVVGYEKDPYLCSIANKKIRDLFMIDKDIIIPLEYPARLHRKPDVYIQVNSVYTNGAKSKREYLESLRYNVLYNGRPDYIFIEMIDSDFKEKSSHFPSFVRVNERDISDLFMNSKINSTITYRYPENSSTKRLFKII